MPKQKPENKLSEKEQLKRFREAAKQAMVDEKKASDAFKNLAHSKKAQRRSGI